MSLDTKESTLLAQDPRHLALAAKGCTFSRQMCLVHCGASSGCPKKKKAEPYQAEACAGENVQIEVQPFWIIRILPVTTLNKRHQIETNFALIGLPVHLPERQRRRGREEGRKRDTEKQNVGVRLRGERRERSRPRPGAIKSERTRPCRGWTHEMKSFAEARPLTCPV